MGDLDEKEKKQLITFLKYFALKSAQVIVQSREGVKIVSRAQTVNNKDGHKHDWFNLAIPDKENVTNVMKQALNGQPEKSLKQVLCIDIILKFNDGGELLLETWTLNLSSEKAEKNVCTSSEVYHRMGLLLKSLLTITRLQPAYKLARKQEFEQYTLTYMVYCGDPKLSRLGPHTKTINIGKLALQIGTMKLSVTYTTDLAMGSNRKNISNEAKDDIMVKSDHFKESPKKDPHEKKVTNLNKPLSTGAFVDVNKIDELHKALQGNLPPEPPMVWLLSQMRLSPQEESNTSQSSKSTNGKDFKEVEEESASNAAHSKAIEVPNSKKSREDCAYHKKLEFPFADGSPITELANFYHECMTARSQSEEWCDVGEEMKSIPSDLESLDHQFKAFEDAVPEFDSMVASMFSNSSDNE